MFVLNFCEEKLSLFFRLFLDQNGLAYDPAPHFEKAGLGPYLGTNLQPSAGSLCTMIHTIRNYSPKRSFIFGPFNLLASFIQLSFICLCLSWIYLENEIALLTKLSFRAVAFSFRSKAKCTSICWQMRYVHTFVLKNEHEILFPAE